ncbi:MAG: hypothetical protein A4E53_03785 [Pelotomaculum sp. PtaB.Bin104]|nr:MAG: hypothetical protein A4E53_03785 [Pelotomaculum sp. PtaB.Bin104]
MKNQVAGRIQVGTGSEITESVIRGPAIIGNDCKIIRSFIGPFTAVGTGSLLEDVGVEHSVILDKCELRQVPRLEDSLIGAGAKVTKNTSGHEALHLFLGDDAEVIL